MHGLSSGPPLVHRRFRGPRRSRRSSEVPEGRLPLDFPNVHGRADLFLDLHGERGPNRWNPGQVVRIGLLKFPQRLESALIKSPTTNAAHAPSRWARRTAPIGPSNGIPDTMSAADAPLIDAMSCGFSWSAPRIVAMTCTSLRKSSGNDGRSGR